MKKLFFSKSGCGRPANSLREIMPDSITNVRRPQAFQLGYTKSSIIYSEKLTLFQEPTFLFLYLYWIDGLPATLPATVYEVAQDEWT